LNISKGRHLQILYMITACPCRWSPPPARSPGRIRNRVAEGRVEGFGEPIRVTCSIGAATSDTPGVWGEHLIARADAAVYDAKRSGRNRVQIAGALPA
jgi:GGDEF domain-containing protein